MNKKKLVCKILEVKPSLYFGGSPDYKYAVYDGKKIVSKGVSSSLGWVKHDAGGYHTQKKFDELYPDGWEVTFDF